MPPARKKPEAKTDWLECSLASLFADSPFARLDDFEESLVRERATWREPAKLVDEGCP